jgi:hypothetical protein
MIGLLILAFRAEEWMETTDSSKTFAHIHHLYGGVRQKIMILIFAIRTSNLKHLSFLIISLISVNKSVYRNGKI